MESRKLSVLWLVILGFLGSGCDSGRVGELESLVTTQEERIAELETKFSEAQDHFEMVKRRFDDLQSAVDTFSDGFTNWRDVVPDVEWATSHLKAALDDLESDLSEY
ncbi:MAG: hypothetical protein AKCLJLPJ_01605 [Fimbriimonadales bacterium]|nr:hypothetical protein [Fimbriimonadales bacterium]